MGEHTAPTFPKEVIEEYAALGIDLPPSSPPVTSVSAWA